MNVVRIDGGVAMVGDTDPVEPQRELTGAVSANERARNLLAQARAVSLEHLAALQETLSKARALSESVAQAGDLYAPGLQDFTKRLGDELLWRSRTLEALTDRQRIAARSR